MKLTESQLRRIVKGVLVSEAQGGLNPQEVAKFPGYINSLVNFYSQITDEDVAALEETGFFSLFSKVEKDLYAFSSSNPNYITDIYYTIISIPPLRTAFSASEMTDVETLRTQLETWARKNPEKAREWLYAAGDELRDLVSNVRRDYKKFLTKSEADRDDPLGRIAFAHSRKGLPFEVDTEVEKNLRRALTTHFEGHELLTPEMAQMIRDFMARGIYSSMFSEPTVGVVYRGMNVSGPGVAWLKKLAGGKLEGKQGSISVNTKYVPREGAASWTTSKVVAHKFFNTVATYHIIMHARVADNPGMFVSAESGLYKTDFAVRYKEEFETLGLGTIQVYKIDWFLGDDWFLSDMAPYNG